jgi:predicted membrane channel-forming protein YqfA (hemolysin III family)
MPGIVWLIAVLVIVAAVMPLIPIPEPIRRVIWVVLGVVLLLAVLSLAFGWGGPVRVYP